jgi:DnaJ like chaperone protein
MSLMGQLIGGGIGFMLGGPIGAILGAVMGDSMSRRTQAGGVGQGDQLQVTFFVATFSMLGKMAAADGTVSREETDTVERFTRNQMRLDERTRKFAMQIFHQAVNSTNRFEEFATQFQNAFSTRPEILRSMFDMLLQVSMADKTLHPEEDKLLLSAVRIFGLSEAEYRRLKKQRIPDTDKYYAVLDSDPSDSMDEIKKKYRKLVQDYHPDKIVAKGLPEEFTKFAQNKFQEIQEAYEHIQKARQVPGATR